MVVLMMPPMKFPNSAGALFVIGIEIMFAGFLVGIMDLPKEQNRKG